MGSRLNSNLRPISADRQLAIVVQDLDAAIQFFAGLGLVLEGRMQVEGDWANRVVGLAGVRSDRNDADRKPSDRPQRRTTAGFRGKETIF